MTDDTTNDMTLLSGADFEREALDDWRFQGSSLDATFQTGDFVTGLELVNKIGAAAEEMNHHPDIELTYPRVSVRLSSHDADGVTQRDVRLARRVSDMAAELGAAPDPETN